MFVCYECRETFDEPVCWREYRGECWGTPAYEELSGCPYCHGTYTEAHRCDCCGEWINTNVYVEVDGKRYCEDCFTIKNLDED